jgi:hypothetical protein
MNERYAQIQAAIGMVGDEISKRQMLIRALTDVRNVVRDGYELLGENDFKNIDFVLKRAAEICGVTMEALIATSNEYLEEEGGSGGP